MIEGRKTLSKEQKARLEENISQLEDSSALMRNAVKRMAADELGQISTCDHGKDLWEVCLRCDEIKARAEKVEADKNVADILSEQEQQEWRDVKFNQAKKDFYEEAQAEALQLKEDVKREVEIQKAEAAHQTAKSLKEAERLKKKADDHAGRAANLAPGLLKARVQWNAISV